MDEPVTISKRAPEQKSMDYAHLREEGIKYIQAVAGKLWTDYNTHDPGITILEILCYALTDLGYRTSYDIRDLLADPTGEAESTYDFFTAAEILPNAPVTPADYRKLMIDVSIDGPDPGCSKIGVKNAWIEQVTEPEQTIYVNKSESKLRYTPVNPQDAPIDLKILHKVLLEFGSCDTYGDLNENTLIRDFVIESHPPDPGLEGVVIHLTIEFPRWDDDLIDWNNSAEIAQGIKQIDLSFRNLGDAYSMGYSLTESNEVVLSGSVDSPSGPVAIDGLSQITTDLNTFIFGEETGMIGFYRQKTDLIHKITKEVKRRLHANRNLCEDFIEFNALRVEEILVCSDIELEADADVDLVQAQIFHLISTFLSPVVHFYTLDEMATRCYDDVRFDITSIKKTDRTFFVAGIPNPMPEPGSAITIDSTNDNSGTYSVELSALSETHSGQTEITVKEQIPTDLLTGSEQLIIGDPVQNPCNSVEKIFEGPLLTHGFIDDMELELADRRDVIHVSDLIQIIMDVDGVAAVKSIQIANDPQDNKDGSIPTKNVRWCLKLAFDKNYVPRLNTDRSKFTFYKDQLPFKASRSKVDTILKDLRANERPQKPNDPGPLDIEPPQGEFKDPEQYVSIQNEFPLVYGIGDEGLPSRADQSQRADLPTAIDAHQLKAYLIHFDQLLANYLSQLAHVRDLFSMNPQKNEFGEFNIARTYFTQSLADLVPDAEPLFINKDDYVTGLDDLAESESIFYDRRNRFLDHLIARFSEQFTDYALLTNQLFGIKNQNELIEDKLAFLNGYPELSSRRGTAFDYRSPCKIWHIDNVSGLQKRASLLTGIDRREPVSLKFSPNFKLSGAEPDISFTVENDASQVILESSVTYKTSDDAKQALESVIVAGVQKENYRIVTENDPDFSFQLICDGAVLAVSHTKDFNSHGPGSDLDQVLNDLIEILCREFFNNPESNRHNLESPLQNYFDVTISLHLSQSPPAFSISYSLFSTPFDFSGTDPLLTGEISQNGPERDTATILSVDTSNSNIEVTGHITEDLVAGDTVHITDSAGNDGIYTIASSSVSADNTVITVEEPIPNDTLPLGTVRYNIITENELQELAESAVADTLWRVVAHASERSRYVFTPSTSPYSSPYSFIVRDLRGDEIGTSTATDFNDKPASELNNLSGETAQLFKPGHDEGDLPDSYTITSASARGPYIDVELDDAPNPVPVTGWSLHISDTFPITAFDRDKRTLTVNEDLTDSLVAEDQISVEGHASNSRAYTIFSIEFDGSATHITVKQPLATGMISEEDDPVLIYVKSFDVVKTSGQTVTIKGGADEKAVSNMIDFIKTTFFGHEGLHLVEHILLRPKINGVHFAEINGTDLSGELADNGNLKFTRSFSLSGVSPSDSKLMLDGDLSGVLASGMSIKVSGDLHPSGTFTIDSVTYSDPSTELTLKEPIITAISSDEPASSLEVRFDAPISSINPDEISVSIPGDLSDSIPEGSLLEISGSTDERNDGQYVAGPSQFDGSETIISIMKVEKHIQDRLLSINLDENCECTLEDPYTCIAHAIIPYWPGRFTNTDFRVFFEQTLRKEAPAHVYLNICWVSNSHIADFERAWKIWLLETNRQPIDAHTLSTTLDELINTIEQLRNVYPKGTLHDCDEDENLENSIILNHSALGEI